VNAAARGAVVLALLTIAASGCARSSAPAPSNATVDVRYDAASTSDTFSIGGLSPQPIVSAYDALAAARAPGETSISVDASPACRYGDVMSVIHAAQHAGFADIEIASGPAAGDALRFSHQSRSSIRANGNRLPRTIVVAVVNDGFISIDNQMTTPGDLDFSLAAAIADHRFRQLPARIALVEDSHTHWETALLIIAAARRANDLDIGFVTQ
jgi:biopolymer transport protein ExbD